MGFNIQHRTPIYSTPTLGVVKYKEYEEVKQINKFWAQLANFHGKNISLHFSSFILHKSSVLQNTQGRSQANDNKIDHAS